MASLVNTKSYEAQARMFGIFSPRFRAKEGDVTTGYFAVRIPSYRELPDAWRKVVSESVGKLFSGMEKMDVNREWKQGKNTHSMLMFRTPDGMEYTDALGEIVKNIPDVTASLSDALSIPHDPLLSERYVRSFQRILEDCSAAMEKPDGDKDARIIVSDMLSRLGMMFQLPFVVPEPSGEKGENPLAELHNAIFSADFGKSLGAWRDLGLVQSHVYGVSPFPIRGTDMLAFKSGDRGPRGAEIKIGWDALLNARPALDALMGLLSSGKAFGKDIRVSAEIVKKNTGKGGYTGDPNGVRSLTGETLFVRIPDEVRSKENPALGGERMFVSLLYAIAKPWLNMSLSPEKLASFIIPEDKLSVQAKSLLVSARAAVESEADVYAQKDALEKNVRDEKSRSTENKMDLEPRIVPYPNKGQVYMLVSTDSSVDSIKEAVSEFVAGCDGIKPPEWRENEKYKYSYAYLTADKESDASPLVSLEGRNQVAKNLSIFIKEKTGMDIGARMPEMLNITIRVGGLAGKKGETYVLVEVPASADKSLRSAAKKGEIKLSDEAKFLAGVKKAMADMTGNEDEACDIEGAGEMVLISNEEHRTVFGVNVTPAAKERETLEAAVEAVESHVRKSVLDGLAEKYPDVSIGTVVKYTKDERAREREKELKDLAAGWRERFGRDASAEYEKTEIPSGTAIGDMDF